MTAIIDEKKCDGCGACDINCPGDIIYMDKVKNVAVVKYPDECWHCACCRMECPQNCIKIVFPMHMIP